MTYEKAREFAVEFLTALNHDEAIQAELLAAVTECFHRYDTGAYENRFIVGAVVEQLLGATARALGFEVENAGARRQAYDLEISANYGLSVKYSSSVGRSARVRLTNSQGAVGVWTTGTIFVLAGVGIGYADAGLVPGATMHSGDSKSLDVAVQPLLQLWERPLRATKGAAPAWLAEIPVPTPRPDLFVAIPIPERAALRSPRLAGDPIALDILQSGQSQTLLANFKWSI